MSAADVTNIYTDRYAEPYAATFIDHEFWQPKHRVNLRVLSDLLTDQATWLDTCCGQGWHLAQFPTVTRVGLDISSAQLSVAAERDTDIELIHDDLTVFDFDPPRRFDVVSNFWGSLSYLADADTIADVVTRMICWVGPGGALYLELIEPDKLAAYNEITFSSESNSRVEIAAADSSRWSFIDVGGVHNMCSPHIDFYFDLCAPHFADIVSNRSMSSMRQFIAIGRR